MSEEVNLIKEKPSKAGAYLVAVANDLPNGDHRFQAQCYYDPEVDKWFRYNPFQLEIKDSILEEIPKTAYIIGYYKGLATALN